MNFLETLDSSIAAFQSQAVKYSNYRCLHALDIVHVAQAFEPIADSIIRVDIDSDCIDVNITGDLETLTGAFRAFRSLGYEADAKPGIDLFTGFSTWFRHPDKKVLFWLSFSSSKCTRTQIGTETQEVPVYEITCE